MQAKFFEKLTPKQQTGRRVPITLQDKVDNEILKQGHFEKLEECSDKYLVSAIVTILKKDGSVKSALESKELIKKAYKKSHAEYRRIIGSVGQTISEKKPGIYFFDYGPDVRLRPTTFQLGKKVYNPISHSLEAGRRVRIGSKQGFMGLPRSRPISSAQ